MVRYEQEKKQRKPDIGELFYARWENDQKIKVDLTEETAKELNKQLERLLHG